MSLRYAALAAAGLLASALAPTAHAQAQESWRYASAIRVPVADTAKAVFFLSDMGPDGTLYFLSSRATVPLGNTTAENALWKLPVGSTTPVRVEVLADTVTFRSVRGVAVLGNGNVLVTTIPKTGNMSILEYVGGDPAQRKVWGNAGTSAPGYGTLANGIDATFDGYVYGAMHFQASMRVYDFTATGTRGWIPMTPANRTEVGGNDACGNSLLRDIALIPNGDYTKPETPFFSTRSASQAGLPANCVVYEGGVAIWTGGTKTAPGPAADQGYTSVRATALDGSLSVGTYNATGITADASGRVWVTGPDASRRWVRAFEQVGGQFVNKAFELPSSTSADSPSAAGAPMMAPVDVSLSPDGNTAYVLDRDADAIWVFRKEGTARVGDLTATGLTLDAPAPNPAAAGRTLLRFALARPGEATLAVYDLLGREVARPVAGALAAGDHEAALATDRLPAGVYLVRLSAEGRTLTQRLVVGR